MRERIIVLCASTLTMVGTLMGWAPKAYGVPVQWSGNGHYYERFDRLHDYDQITWLEARVAAESQSYLGAQGYLVTITSQEENDFIINNLGGEAIRNKWLGGFETSEGVWNWVTGEEWKYTNWDWDQPDNFYRTLDGLNFHWRDTLGVWNDHPQTFVNNGYIVEYVPEPTTMCLLGLGGLTILRKRRG